MAAGRDSEVAAEVRAEEVIAFRMHAQNLDERRPTGRLHEVAGACGVQDSPPGSALLALGARVEGVTPERIDELLGGEKSLLQSWCMRGAPFWFPTADAAVFTAGAMPTTEAGRLHLIVGVEQALRQLGMELDEAVAHTAAQIGTVLSGRRLAINELGAELAERIAGELPALQRKTWQAIGPHAANQPLGEAVVHFCMRILTLRGTVCLAPRSGNKAPFVLLAEWLGRPLPQADADGARAALLRRYLHCYGPSTRKDFAAWLGVQAGDVDPWWNGLADRLVPVEFGGRRAWALAEDLDALRSPPPVRGVRLLPPRDPYTQMRDRETIVDKRYHQKVWKTVGEPGAVLADGNIVGTWRARKQRSRLTLTVEPFGSACDELRARLHEEAGRVAELRGAAQLEVAFGDTGR